MEDLSEAAIRKNCPHCEIHSQAFVYALEETDNFHIICDSHPLKEGHILIIPKNHISCVGEYSAPLLNEFTQLDNKVSKFVLETYGSLASFEHGVFGQSVFHSHIHYMPFTGSTDDIVPEGKSNLATLNSFTDLKQAFEKEGGYLFFSIGDDKWTVNVQLAQPRFFRDRFAETSGKAERGDWKAMHQNKEIMQLVEYENRAVQKAWANQN